MTYHPYFRGKQYELITIREKARLMAQSGFVPIVEPVKEALGGLERTLKAVCEANGKVVVIVNPYHGDHRENGEIISTMLEGSYGDRHLIEPGILLKHDTTIEDVVSLYHRHRGRSISLIHAGFNQPKLLADALSSRTNTIRNVFFDKNCGKLYRKHFQSEERILLHDGFERRKNREHPTVEPFSDLNVTFEEEGMTGFGDFLIVGDDYSETGGPAYAVAIHITFIDSDKDDAMFIYHFVSDSQDTPTDPAGKFAEALAKLMRMLNRGESNILETDAIREFRELHRKGHFPGLGYVKKLSMNHHIETLADFLG
ncbi:sce7725 family protein [Methylocystis sp. JAN1]|uniref:sce7725 family protein n=1 Tax=Methylocystis sp. JAN1 TaxID=3397211 RepID=UPI003FA1FAD0